jgi:hypothetical protein
MVVGLHGTIDETHEDRPCFLRLIPSPHLKPFR